MSNLTKVVSFAIPPPSPPHQHLLHRPPAAGIIAVVIFTILCTLVFLIRYMFRHKGTYHTHEAKGAGAAGAEAGVGGESADTAIIGTDNPETIDESKKEWFI